MTARGLPAAVGLLFCLVLGIRTAGAETAWVSDRFEVMLRTGPSTNNAIQLMLDSGTELEVLERDPDSGYSRVRTGGGTEGWVLSRYLMDEPSAREQLAQLTSQLADVQAEGSSLSSQLQTVRNEYNAATERIEQLEREKAELESQLEEIRRKAADVLAIDNQNQRLQEQLTDARIRIDTLSEENRSLTGRRNRNWFLTGASVLFAGILLGILLPRIRWQRRSRYERF